MGEGDAAEFTSQCMGFAVGAVGVIAMVILAKAAHHGGPSCVARGPFVSFAIQSCLCTMYHHPTQGLG